MASRLDELALALTAPVSRRSALRLAAATVIATYFARGTDTARAVQCPECPRQSDPPNYSQRCVVFTNLGCIFVCCPPEFKCCTASHGVVCCREGYTCGPVQTVGEENYPSCICQNACGGACCKSGEKCANPDRGLCCKIPCGDTCCREGEKCADPNLGGTCCKSYEKACIGKNQTVCCDELLETCCAGTTGFAVTQCCGQGQTCTDEGDCRCRPGHPVNCHGDACCRRDQRCCQSPTGKGFCIPKKWRCCGDSFADPALQSCCAGRFPYSRSTQRCCGISGVCFLNEECCPDGCCPAGSSCCANGCCSASGARVGPRRPFARVRDRRSMLLHVERRRARRRGAAR